MVRNRAVCSSSFDHPPTSETQPEPQEQIQDPEGPGEMGSPAFYHQVTS